MQDKKALFADIWPPIVYIIFIIILVFLFSGYQIYKEKSEFNEIRLIQRDIETHQLLMDYLQKNTTFDINNDGIQEKITMTDLIISSVLQDKKDIYKHIEKETERILLNYKRSDRSGFNMVISLVYDRGWFTGATKPKYDDKVRVETYTHSGKYSPLSEALIILPFGIDDKYIMIVIEEEADILPW